MLDVNLRGLLLPGRAFVDALLGAADRGQRTDLVLTGSIGSGLTFPTYGVYCATKAAVAHLARNLRVEYGPRGLRVKNVEPGLTATELGDDMADARGRKVLTDMRARVPSLAADDVAAAIAFAVAAPAHVNIAELVVVPTAQGWGAWPEPEPACGSSSKRRSRARPSGSGASWWCSGPAVLRSIPPGPARHCRRGRRPEPAAQARARRAPRRRRRASARQRTDSSSPRRRPGRRPRARQFHLGRGALEAARSGRSAAPSPATAARSRGRSSARRRA